MRSNAGMATRRRDVDLRFAQVSALRTLAWLGLAWPGYHFYAQDGTASKFRNVSTKSSEPGDYPKDTIRQR